MQTGRVLMGNEDSLGIALDLARRYGYAVRWPVEALVSKEDKHRR